MFVLPDIRVLGTSHTVTTLLLVIKRCAHKPMLFLKHCNFLITKKKFLYLTTAFTTDF